MAKQLQLLSTAAFLCFSLMLSGCSTDGGAANAEGGDTTAKSAADNPAPDPNANPNAQNVSAGAGKFDWVSGTTHNFGNVNEGEKPTFEFKFKNTGTDPIVLVNVKPSCGCTTPEWTREPVPPGGTGFIRVEFDSNGRLGENRKNVTVEANTEPPFTQLTFTANVLAKGGNGANS